MSCCDGLIRIDNIRKSKEDVNMSKREGVIAVGIISLLVMLALPNILSAVSHARRETDFDNGAVIYEAALEVQREYPDMVIKNLNITKELTLPKEAVPTTFAEAMYVALDGQLLEPRYKGDEKVNEVTDFVIYVFKDSIEVHVVGGNDDVLVAPIKS